MKSGLSNLLPWLVVIVIAAYVFFFMHRRFDKAISDLKDAKTRIDSAYTKISTAEASLVNVRTSLDSFSNSSDLLFENFTTVSNRMEARFNSLSPRITELNSTLKNKLAAELRNRKPIEIINH
jgi:hypothetical protein